MDENRLTQLEFKQNQLFDRVDNLEKSPKSKKDIWDIMSAATPLISSILISGIGLYFAYSNNEAQLKLQETQTIEKFFPHLSGTEQEKKAAILAISSLTNTETAAKYAELFPSEGTASALKTIANSGSSKASDKDVANKALVNTFHKMADGFQARQDTKQVIEAYQESVDAQAKLAGTDSPDLIDDLQQLADAYQSDHKYDLSEAALRRILKIEKNSSGTNNPQFTATLNKLAAILKLEGKNDAADHLTDYANLLAQQKSPDIAQNNTNDNVNLKESSGTAGDTTENQSNNAPVNNKISKDDNHASLELSEAEQKSINKAENHSSDPNSRSALSSQDNEKASM